MTITIETPADAEDAILQKAAREGLSVQEFTLRLLLREAAPSEPMPSVRKPAYDHTDALFDQWAREDATDDPEELARRQREGDAFMASLAANRLNIPRDSELLRILEIPDGGEQNADV